ncbi:hypothetical protein ACFLQW_02075 [Candidatus Zixiibacteriota bacterium]
MDRYFEAAVAIDHIKQIRDKRRKTFNEVVDKFMNASPNTDLDPAQVDNLFTGDLPAKIDERLERFRTVRGHFISSLTQLTSAKSGTDQPESEPELVEIQPLLFEMLAIFDAAGLEYAESRDLLIEDEDFDNALKMLTALGKMMSESKDSIKDKSKLARSIDLVTEYYKEADYLFSRNFYNSHHRKDDFHRFGPFCYSSGSTEAKIERPAVCLNPEELKIFHDRWGEVLARHGFNSHEIGLIIAKIGPEPVAFIRSYGILSGN